MTKHKNNNSILIKLSGEALSRDGEKYASEILEELSRQIAKLLSEGVKVALVVGGGNLFRGAELTSQDSSLQQSTGDYIGMLATLQNALVIRDHFEARDIPARVLSSITVSQLCEPYIPERGKRHMEKGRVVIFAAGLGVPFFTTDTTAVQRALEIESDMMVLSKNGVDGLYDGDPQKDRSASKISQTTGSQFLEKGLKAADGAAIALAKDNSLPIKVISVSDIERIFDEEVGSRIDPS